MITRAKILKELEIQESIQGVIDNKELILKIVAHCKMSSEIEAMLNVKYHQYGKSVMNSHRFWFIKHHLINLFKES